MIVRDLSWAIINFKGAFVGVMITWNGECAYFVVSIHFCNTFSFRVV